MKLKTYFGPKAVRVLAILLLVLALGYALVTVLDVVRPQIASILSGGKTQEPPPPVLPPSMMNTPIGRQQQAQALAQRQDGDTAAADRAAAEKQAEDARRAAEAKKAAEEKAAADRIQTGKKFSGMLGDCRVQNKEWFACNTDKECVEIIGVCGARDAANRSFRNEAENCSRAAGADIKCDPFPIERIAPRCVNKICTAQKRETKQTPKTP